MTTPDSKLPPTVECARLFRAAFGVGPVLGPSRDVQAAIEEGRNDPATVLGMMLIHRSIVGEAWPRFVGPSEVIRLQADAGWQVSSESLRYVDWLTSAPAAPDVPAFPGSIWPPVIAVRWLAHKRDRMQLAKSPQSLVELALAALARAVVAHVKPEVDEGTARVVEQILESRAHNGQLTEELSSILASMLRDERAEDDARFAYIARDLEIGFGEVDPHGVAADLAFKDDPDAYEPEERHYARATRIGIDAEREKDRALADKESTS